MKINLSAHSACKVQEIPRSQLSKLRVQSHQAVKSSGNNNTLKLMMLRVTIERVARLSCRCTLVEICFSAEDSDSCLTNLFHSSVVMNSS